MKRGFPEIIPYIRRKNTNDYEDVRVPRLGGRVTAFLLHSPIPWLTASIIILSSCLLPATIIYLPYLSIYLSPFSLTHDDVNTTYHIPTTIPTGTTLSELSSQVRHLASSPLLPSVQCPLSGRAPMSPVKVNATLASDDKELPIWDRLVAEGNLR